MATATKKVRAAGPVGGRTRDPSELAALEFLIYEDNGGRYREDRCCCRLDDGIAHRDPRVTRAAPAAQGQPRHHGNVVPVGQRGSAMGAA